MYNLDNIVKIYFNSVSVKSIISGVISFDTFSKEEFTKLSAVYLRRYSDTENFQLYQYIQDSAQEEGHPYAGLENRSGLNVFAALEELSEQLLVLEHDKVLCQYRKLLRLREVSQYIEEDLLICAFLAMRYRRYAKEWQDFGWDLVIGHNNVQLDRIMERGICENHFHLYGSAPSFHLIWLYFMNYADVAALYEFEKTVEKQRRMTRGHYGMHYSEESLVAGILKARLIRVRLIYDLYCRDMPMSERRQKFLKSINEMFPDDEIRDLLSGERDILERYDDIQRMIDWMKDCACFEGWGELEDYALYPMEDTGSRQEQNHWAAGERWLIYQMLKEELDQSIFEGSRSKEYYNWFYAYLVLKQKLRNEITQTNDMVGFENFSIYSKRKDIYNNRKRMVETAVFDSVAKGNIRCLEIRVTPEKSAQDNAIAIQNIIDIIEQGKEQVPEFDYYFVLHFPKRQDEPLGERKDFDGLCCRHHKKRLELEQRAYEIRYFRENWPQQASRILGIDACAQEIGCRPEVFAPVFRFLASHRVERIQGMEKVSQLKMTYHVGEDFLDIVDGLRAVDEAVLFLKLRCGDRIGHGTVLGLDVREWYKFKQYTIILSRQDYLDNIVWLYHKLVEYKIEGFDHLRERLQQEFHIYFAEVYLQTDDGKGRALNFDIDTYYEAWKLRGDEPELYKKGYFDENGVLWGEDWRINRKLSDFSGFSESRNIAQVVTLFYLYHYDWDVRKNGEKKIEKYVLPYYVEGVAAVQRAMQKEFASRGIGIEANPSSNYAISTMQEYSEHPIVKLYNKDLTCDMTQVRDCPQVNISINTDDKGVFHTSLENEYALMACAVEKKKDEKGNHLYDRQMVYQWIDNIREMGNMQSFAQGSKREDAREDGRRESMGKDSWE